MITIVIKAHTRVGTIIASYRMLKNVAYCRATKCRW